MEVVLISRNFTERIILIDEQDFYLVDKIRWHVFDNHTGKLYVRRSDKGKNIFLHRVIMGLNNPDLYVDHINHNGLDNRRCNLRIATHSDNMKNKSSKKNGSSKYLGVCWAKNNNKWVANINVDRKTKFLGYFVNEIDAAKAYDIAAIDINGEFANLNFKDEYKTKDSGIYAGI